MADSVYSFVDGQLVWIIWGIAKCCLSMHVHFSHLGKSLLIGTYAICSSDDPEYASALSDQVVSGNAVSSSQPSLHPSLSSFVSVSQRLHV